MFTDEDKILDEALAAYTDHLLDDAPPPAGPPDQEIEELPALQETVAQLWQTLGRVEPDAALRERIRHKLAGRRPAPPRPSLLARLRAAWSERLAGWRPRQQRRRRQALALGLVLLLMLLVALPLLTDSAGLILPGAAAGPAGPLPLILILALLLGGIIWRFFGRD